MTISFFPTRNWNSAPSADAPASSSRLSLIVSAAAAATAVDLCVAIVYWAPYGAPPAQLLRSVATWVLGSGAPATLPVMALGLAVLFAIFLAMAIVFEQLIAARFAPVRSRFLLGAAYGAAAYLLTFQVLVPILAYPVALDRSAGWIAACLAAHALVIGPLLASTLCRPAASMSHRTGSRNTA
jgi:hypothetical protein